MSETPHLDHENLARPAARVLSGDAFRPGAVPPDNGGKSPDRKLRRLDSAVFNFYLKALERDGITPSETRLASSGPSGQ